MRHTRGGEKNIELDAENVHTLLHHKRRDHFHRLLYQAQGSSGYTYAYTYIDFFSITKQKIPPCINYNASCSNSLSIFFSYCHLF